MAALEQLLNRPRRTPWEDFLRAPTVFLSHYLFRRVQDQTARDLANVVSVVCISDTHNSQPQLPHADLLIHAGDLTQSGSLTELQATLAWLKTQPHTYKVVVAGNHDVLLDKHCDRTNPSAEAQRAQLDWGDITYLQDEKRTLEFENGRVLSVYGSPRSARNGNWAFQYPRSQDVWTDSIPAGIDILITHGPPRAHLDCLNLGCVHLLKNLWRVRPKLHVFGHVHEGHGQEWLRFDGLQRAYERVVVSKGGLLDGLRVGWEYFKVWTGFGDEETGRRGSLLVNAAVVGGLRDNERRRPVRVVI